MQKKIISLTILFFAILSCENQLDRFPLDAVSPEIYFTNEVELKLYTNSFYNALPSAESVYAETADNIITQNLSDEIQGIRIVPTSGGGWDWGALRNINFYLENSAKMKNENIRNRYDAVAHFFRAYFYFEKVKRFGDVPWYSTTIGNEETERLTKPRDSRVLIMDSIIMDIDFAIQHLPSEKRVNEVSKWTALALKSRLCLFEGTYRKYHSQLNLPHADRFLEWSYKAAEELMRESGYDLYSTENPQTDYLNLFAAHQAIPKEIILARSFSDDVQVYHNLNYYTMTASYGRPGLDKKIVNSYLNRDGSRFTDQEGFESIPFSKETENRDPRLSQTIRTPGYTRIGENETLIQQFGATVTGYQLIKFVTESKWDTYMKDMNDMPLFRYAEVLLNFAEAKAELNQLTQGDLDQSVNLIRKRVDMPPLILDWANANPDPYLASHYKQVKENNRGVILEIRRERRIELVMENFRYYDLMRWREGHLLAAQFKGMYFPGTGKYDIDNDGIIDLIIYKDEKPPSDTNVQYLKLGEDILLEQGESGNILINAHIKKVWNEEKDYLYPIPIQERALNPNLTQNPGWEDGL